MRWQIILDVPPRCRGDGKRKYMIGLPIVSFDFATADVTTTAGLGENSLAIVSTQRRLASSAKSPR